MWGNSIAARVNRVIKERIKVAQQKHDARIEEIEEEAEQKIEASASELVEEIIGKK